MSNSVRTPNIEDVINTVLAYHPKDCIFINDAAKYIADKSNQVNLLNSKEDFLEFLEQEIRQAEIYCPHENINRMPNI